MHLKTSIDASVPGTEPTLTSNRPGSIPELNRRVSAGSADELKKIRLRNQRDVTYPAVTPSSNFGGITDVMASALSASLTVTEDERQRIEDLNQTDGLRLEEEDDPSSPKPAGTDSVYPHLHYQFTEKMQDSDILTVAELIPPAAPDIPT